MSDNLKAIVLMLASVFAVSVVSLFAKFIGNNLNMPELVLLRFAVPGLMLTVLLIGQKRLEFPIKYWPTHIVRAITNVLSQYCFLICIVYDDNILDAILLYSTSPIFIVLLYWLIDRKPVNPIIWFSVIISFLGVIIVLHPNEDLFDGYMAIGLASGFFNACSQLTFHHTTNKQQLSSSEASLAMYFYSTAIAILFLPLAFILHTNHSVLTYPASLIALFFIGLGMASLFNQLARGIALQLVDKVASISPLLYFVIIFAGIWDWLVFSIEPSSSTTLGSSLIIFGGILLFFNKPAGLRLQ